MKYIINEILLKNLRVHFLLDNLKTALCIKEVAIYKYRQLNL